MAAERDLAAPSARPTPHTTVLGIDQRRVNEWMCEYRATGDRVYRNRAVEALIPLADYYARMYERRGVAREDLRQVALLAMVRAAERFDPAAGALFGTFASRTIEGELKRYHRDRSWSVRPPRAMQERFLAARAMHEDMAHELGRSPTVDELARRLECTVEQLLDALDLGAAHHASSLDQQVPGPDGGGRRTIGDSLADGNDEIERLDDRMLLVALVERLDPVERTIIEMHYFEGKTQQEIADILSISQSYLSRVLRRMMARLRERAVTV